MRTEKAVQLGRCLRSRVSVAAAIVGCGIVLASAVSQAGIAEIKRSIADSEYEFSWHEHRNAHFAPNRANNLRFRFEGPSFSVEPRDPEGQVAWSATFSLIGYGRGVAVAPISAESFVPNKAKATVDAGEIEIHYENTKAGMRQSFLIKSRPAGGDILNLRFTVQAEQASMIVDEEANAVVLSGGRGEMMTYDDLKAWDARGVALNAQMKQIGAGGFGIFVDDSAAEYPVYIDPLSSVKTYTESQSGAQFGFSVCDGSEIWGNDGGILIGAPLFDNGANLNVGKVFLYHTTSGTLPANPTWTKLGENAGDRFGFSLTKRNFNSDDWVDIAIGAPYYDSGIYTDAGKVYAFYGSSGGLPSTASWSVTPVNQSYAHAGWAVAGVLANNDTLADLAVGVPFFDNITQSGTDPNVGRVYVYHSPTTSGLSSSPAWSYTGTTDSQLGYSLADVPNYAQTLNPHSALAVGAPVMNYFGNALGAVLIFHGSGSTGFPSSPNTTIWGPSSSGQFGFSLASGVQTDIDNDDYNDLVVGEPYFSNGQASEGKVYVFDNSGTGFSTTPWWSAESNQTGARFGYSVAAGDLDGDGIADVFAGAPYWDETVTDGGKAYFYKSTGSTLNLNTVQIGGTANAHVGMAVGFGEVEGSTKGFIVGTPDDSGGVVSVWKWVP